VHHSSRPWLRCYRCWSQRLEAHVLYDATLGVDPLTAEALEPTEQTQGAVLRCLDCRHDQPHLELHLDEAGGRRLARVEAVAERWERMVAGTPWIASCAVALAADEVEDCDDPQQLLSAALEEEGMGECFAQVRFHEHKDGELVVQLLVEFYARSGEEATRVLESAARGPLTIGSLAEDSVPPAGVGESGPQ
jgi:hypothetical protein